jgi:hypothetical protein
VSQVSNKHPQWVAKSGILPPCLTTCRAPQCVSSHNDKASRRPWRRNGSANKMATATSPGQIVVLHNHDNKNQLKWEPCAQPVRYLSSLTNHASFGALLCDPYQLKFEDPFDTVSLSRPSFQGHQSGWQHLCPFEKGKKDTPRKAVEHPRDTNMSIVPVPSPPGDTSNINGDETIASEGVSQGGEHETIASEGVDQDVAQGKSTPMTMTSEIVIARRYWRTRLKTHSFTKSQQQLADGILSYLTTHEAIDPKLYPEDLLLKELEVCTVLVKSITNSDTLYLMYAPDVAQFKETLKKEGSKHTRKGHWEIHRRTEVPSHSKILLAVWSKTRIDLREVSKHKARLNPRGHKQEYRRNSGTYSRVVKWTSIRLMTILSAISGWSTQQLDFVMGYSQADIYTNHVYIEFSKGGDTRCVHVIKKFDNINDNESTNSDQAASQVETRAETSFVTTQDRLSCDQDDENGVDAGNGGRLSPHRHHHPNTRPERATTRRKSAKGTRRNRNPSLSSRRIYAWVMFTSKNTIVVWASMWSPLMDLGY